MRLDGGELEVLEEGLGSNTAALDLERHDAATAVRQVLLGNRIVGVARQARVAHALHLGLVLQELSHCLAVLHVARHAHVQALKAEVEQEGVLRRLDGAQIAHELRGRLGDEGPLFAKLLGVGDAVIALVRRGETGELVGVSHPVELARVDDGAAHSCAVAVHVLGGGVRHDVSAPLDGTTVDRRGERVVHDERHTVGMRGVGELLNVKHRERRVGDGLAEDGARIVLEGRVELGGRAVGRNERGLDAHLRHGHAYEVERAAVDGGGGHNVATGLADVEQRKEVRRLARRGQHGGRTALELGDLCGNVVVRGVLQARVEVARCLEVKELAHILARVVLERGGLHNRNLARLPVAGGVPALDTYSVDALVAHGVLSCASAGPRGLASVLCKTMATV